MTDKTAPAFEPTKSFKALAHKSLDGTLVESEVRELNDALRQCPDSRRWYAELVMLHCQLTEHCEANELSKTLHDEFPAASPARSKNRSPGQAEAAGWAWPQTRRVFPRWAIAATLLLASSGLGCGVGIYAASVMYYRPAFLAAPWDWDVGPEVVARVESSHNAVWQPSDVPDTLPTLGLRVGQRVRLTSGLMSLSFQGGGGVILEGPALFEVRSHRGGKLFNGKLSVLSPDNVEPYVVVTPVGEASFGAGHFGVEVRDVDTIPSAAFHAMSGPPQEGPSAYIVANAETKQGLSIGESCVVDLEGNVTTGVVAGPDEFLVAMPPRNWERFADDSIPLGNLFDDSKSASLSEAVRSDSFQAAGETIDLGIAAIRDGGLDVDVALAEGGVSFNFKNVGGGGARVRGLPGNDTSRSVSDTPIRTRGLDLEPHQFGVKAEDGVGMCTNEMLTFDLDELRSAGLLGGALMRFVADRVGINDRGRQVPNKTPNIGSSRFVVVVSTTESVLAGYVDGEEYPVTARGNVHQFDLHDKTLPPVIRRDGRYVSFDVPLPPKARFLTLATTMHDQEHDDHAVFSGARIEVLADLK